MEMNMVDSVYTYRKMPCWVHRALSLAFLHGLLQIRSISPFPTLVSFLEKILFLHNFNVMTSQFSNTKRYEPNFAQLLYTCKKEGLRLFTNAPEQPVYQVSNYQQSASNAGVEEQKPGWESTHVTQEGVSKACRRNVSVWGQHGQEQLNLLKRRPSPCFKDKTGEYEMGAASGRRKITCGREEERAGKPRWRPTGNKGGFGQGERGEHGVT